MKKLISLFLLTVLCAAAKADNWMKDLPDDTPVCLVSIPGTHDSATGYGFTGVVGTLGGGTYATTQDKNISEQWALGVRAFDFRPAVNSSSKLVLWHGVCQTKESIADAFQLLHDSLEANPTEFAVIHLRHETDAYSSLNSNSNSKYEESYESLLSSAMETYPDMFVDYRRDLTVGDMRGKALVLYRDSYTTAPTGGIMSNWPGDSREWSAQTAVTVQGAGSGSNAKGRIHAQDYSDSSEDGGLGYKVAAVDTMLNYSTTHYAYNKMRNVWVFNFASAYSETGTLAGYTLSKSDGYRENASYTNKAIVDYLSSHSGPTGIILADYVGVDTSNKYSTNGLSLVNAIIDNNFKYLPTEEEAVDESDITDQLGATVDASDGTTGWTTSNIGTMSSQHWSDDPSDSYFEMSGSLYSSATKWTATMTKTISVENGLYRLKAAGRSSSGALCTIDLNGTSYSFPAQGDTGGTMDIDGVEWESLAIGKAAGATFANNGAGRGWRWGSVDALVTDGKLAVTITLQNTSGSASQWASIDDIQLYYLGASTEALDDLIEQASELNTTANLGDGLFQFPTTVASNLATALATAKQVDENPDATQDEVNEALLALQTAYDTYTSTPLNQPEEGQLYNIIKDNPISFHTDQTATGGYAFDCEAAVDPLRGQAFNFNSTGKQDCYTISFTGTDGKTHYLFSDKVAALSTDSATVFQVKATTEEGSWDIEGLASGLSFSEAELVTVTPVLEADTLGTVILPFYSSLPEGVTAYSCAALQDDGETLNLVKVSALKANTPYIICCPSGEAPTFEGAGTWHDSYSLQSGLLTGTLEETSLGQGSYVLSTDDEGTPVFSLVTGEGETLAAFQCSLSLTDTETLPDVLYIVLPDNAEYEAALAAAQEEAEEDIKLTTTAKEALEAAISDNTFAEDSTPTAADYEAATTALNEAVAAAQESVTQLLADYDDAIAAAEAAVETYDYEEQKQAVQALIDTYTYTDTALDEATGDQIEAAITALKDFDATAIEAIGAEAEDDEAVYTLQGVRVSKPTKGIYIKGGKKVIVK
ncbi:MAG: hypothetical protein LUC33_06280 [Prevotellaceae bacterium]|nr:hypothetical protein [Prevotellaceae bacterium]